MHNNDIVIRLKYALSLSNQQVIAIFQDGGVTIDANRLEEILTKDIPDAMVDHILSTHDLEAFLNGLVIFKRGQRLSPNGEVIAPTFDITDSSLINNVTIKKIKIAMAYTSQDIQNLMTLVGDQMSNGELSAILRRPGHRNYRPAGDRYLRKILQGMAKKYR